MRINYQHRVWVHAVGMMCLVITSQGISPLPGGIWEQHHHIFDPVVRRCRHFQGYLITNGIKLIFKCPVWNREMSSDRPHIPVL
jgi:hypothetical protein